MTSSSLIDDICEELLVCRICLEPLRHPKTLSCRHTFCEVCLERLRDSELPTTDDDDVRLVTSRRTSTTSRRTHGSAVPALRLTCPVCYESCPLPPGGVSRLPDDPVLTQLYNVIERRKSQSADGSGVCEICCKSTTTGVRPRHRAAHVKCVECGKLLCSHCARLHRRTNTFDLNQTSLTVKCSTEVLPDDFSDSHTDCGTVHKLLSNDPKVTSGHSLLDIDDAELSMECQHHAGELVRFYCDTCHVCVCVLCTYRGQPHSDDHDVLSFSDAVAVHQAPLTALLAQCRQRLCDVRARYDAVAKFDQLVRKVEDNIHEVATETVSQIRRQERQLVSALHELCGDETDDETRVETKKELSEHVRRLEDACDAADKQLHAISEGSGPAAFLLQRRRTVDAMTSLMTSQTTGAADWLPVYERQVRFEAYGLDSALGRLVSDVEAESQQRERNDVNSAHQHSYAVAVPSDDGGAAKWTRVKLSDIGVQADDEDQSLTPSSRCEASGSVSVSTTRRLMIGGTSPTSTPRRPQSPAAAAPVTSLSSEPVTSLCDASTSTATVHVVSSSTVTDQPVTCDQSTFTDMSSAVCHDQQTSTEPLPDVHHRSTSTDQPQTRSLSVTAAPSTTDKSTSTIHPCTDEHVQLQASDDGHADLTQTTSCSTCTASTVNNGPALQDPHNSTSGVNESFVSAETSVTSPQTAPASTVNVPHLSLATAGSADNCESILPSRRLAALLPEITRTADVLEASHFSSGLTAQLLREIVDVGQRMTSSSRDHTRDAATDNREHQPSNALDEAQICSEVKWTQTAAECSDMVDTGVGQSVVTTSDASTLAKLAPITFDKETLTARAHQVNRTVSTDSLSTANKQTWMSVDVTSAYLASTAATTRRVVSVSRGTATPSTFTAPPQPLVDRATSPIRVTLVDKSVTANKAEALQPLDTFQAPGQLSGPLSPRSRRPLSLSPRSKLACISETAEQCDEDKAEELDDVSGPDWSASNQMRSPQRAFTSTQLPTTPMSRLLLQQQPDQFSRNVFNFDHVVTSRFAALSAAPLDDVLTTLSSASQVYNFSSAGETAATQDDPTHDEYRTEPPPPVDN